jgi:endo-1,4-beta-xylanase
VFYRNAQSGRSPFKLPQVLRDLLRVSALAPFACLAVVSPLHAQEQSLKQAASMVFPIGVGISDKIAEQPESWDLLNRHFSIVTPENCMKPDPVQREPGKFNFDLPDQFVEFAVKNNLKVVGHCLVWAKDDRTPPWFFKDGDKVASRELLLDRMRTHVTTEVARYKGKIAQWDVVNEAIDDGAGYLRSSGWTTACGEEFIAEAFRAAHLADPDALLIYNDYNNEKPQKREKMLRLVGSLLASGVPVHAIGLQGHYEIDQVPLAEIEATIEAVKAIGLKVVVSELDIDVIPRGKWWAENGKYREELAKLDPYAEGCPPEILQRQAEQYAALFAIFRKHKDSILRISFWNLHDGQSWLNYFPWKRVNHPLLFDRQQQPKPAFQAVLNELTKPL